jgi:2-polyprenyl-3-methyl-5-hydroxy-6-metoxy-1,4-benzoquinol methylase
LAAARVEADSRGVEGAGVTRLMAVHWVCLKLVETLRVSVRLRRLVISNATAIAAFRVQPLKPECPGQPDSNAPEFILGVKEVAPMSSKNTSNYDASGIANYFDDLGIREWNRLLTSPVDEVSLYIHAHYLSKHVRPGSRVLEIGAGAGRFTQILADLGARVLVADVSQVQLDLNRQHAHQYGFAHAVEAWQQVDICDMGRFEPESFDPVVAYGGPLSYVLGRRDTALQECIRVLKRHGSLLLSVMSLWGAAHRYLDGVLGMPMETNQKVTATGDISPETFPERLDHMHLFRAGELREWLTKADLSILALSASSCLSTGWNDLLAGVRSDSEKWEELLRMELEACAEEGSLNMGTHIIAVAERR